MLAITSLLSLGLENYCSVSEQLYESNSCCDKFPGCTELQKLHRSSSCCDTIDDFDIGDKTWLHLRTSYYASKWSNKLRIPGTGNSFETEAERKSYVQSIKLEPSGSDNDDYRAYGLGWASCATFDYYFRGNCDGLAGWGFPADKIQEIKTVCPVTCFAPAPELGGMRVALDDFSRFMHPRDVGSFRRLEETECPDCDPATFYDDISGMRFQEITGCNQTYAIVLKVMSDGYIAKETDINRGTIISHVNGKTFADTDEFLTLFNENKFKCLQQPNATEEGCKGTSAIFSVSTEQDCELTFVKNVTVYRGPVYDDVFTFSKVENKIGFFKFSNFFWNPLFRTKLMEMLSHDLEHLIIDLRDNTGGYVSAFMKLASALGLSYSDMKAVSQDTQLFSEGTYSLPNIMPAGFVAKSIPKLSFVVNANTDSASLHLMVIAAKNMENVEVIGSTKTGKSFKLGVLETQPVPMMYVQNVLFMTGSFKTPLEFSNPTVWDGSIPINGITPTISCESTEEILAYDNPKDDCFAKAFMTERVSSTTTFSEGVQTQNTYLVDDIHGKQLNRRHDLNIV